MPVSKKKKAAVPKTKKAARPKTKPGTGKSTTKTATPRGTAPPPGRTADVERALADAREQIRMLTEDRDNQVAIADAADAERGMLQRELDASRERLREMEEQLAEGPIGEVPHGDSGTPAAAGDAAADFDPEEEEIEPGEDIDDVESIYKRMDDPRVRRDELDRERLDRESEFGNELFWMVCPKCGDSMDEIDSDDLKIERCENCGGVYLDRGELDLLLSLGRGPKGLRRMRSALSL